MIQMRNAITRQLRSIRQGLVKWRHSGSLRSNVAGWRGQFYAPAAETAILELEAAAMEPYPLSPGTADSNPPAVPVERTPWFPPLRPENKALYERMRELGSTAMQQQSVSDQVPGGLHILMGMPPSPATSESDNDPANPNVAPAVDGRGLMTQDGWDAARKAAMEVMRDAKGFPIHPPQWPEIFNKAEPSKDGIGLRSVSNPMPGDEQILADQEAEGLVFDQAPAPKDAPLLEALKRQREKDWF